MRREDSPMPSHRERTQGYKLVFCGCLALLLPSVSCQQAPPNTQAADQNAIKDLETRWSKAAGAKNVDDTVSFYADDASLLPPNTPIATGKQAIRSVWTEMLGNPGFSASWESTKAEAASSGDFAYDIGTYQLTLNDPQGKPTSDRGKYVVVWKKQADGKWKATADMFSSDLPLPTPPAAEKKKK
jgi:uncharacterized protein (TIGR02246 family)